MLNMFKNKKGGVPMIWIVIAIGAFVFTFSLIVTGYGNFMMNNGGTLDSSFMQNYYNISSRESYYTGLAENQYNIIDTFAIVVKDFIFSGLNLFVSSIKSLASGARTATDLIETTKTVFPWAGTLIGFLVFATTIYIAYKFMQVIRGQAQEI